MKEFGNIEEYIPHRGKMLLLSRLTDYALEPVRSVSAEFDVTRDCIFFDEDLGGIPAWATFEIMAQTISTMVGIMMKELGRPQNSGMILNVSGFNATQEVFAAGSTLKISAKEDFYDADTSIYKYACSLKVDGADGLAAQADIMVMETPDLKKLFEE